MRAPRFGGAGLRNALESLGSINAVVSAPRRELRRIGLSDETIGGLKHPDTRLIDSDIEWLAEPHHALLTWDSERYPPLLRDIPDPPAALYVDGDPDVLWQPQVAMVGSRNPTAGGLDNARSFGRELAGQGLAIVSGLAAGIDAASHAAALDAGGSTVAVTGTGLDIVYPARNRGLAERIRARGALVSEFPLGTASAPGNFPRRNRIISGLSLGVLVVEASLNSGSLITARLAGEQGREVFALPGSIHNPMAKGCHRLIRQGARLTETVDEIMQELAPLAGRLAAQLRTELHLDAIGKLEIDTVGPNIERDSDYRKLWNSLGHDPLPVDAIIDASGLTPKAVSAMLLMLELKGEVEAHPGGVYSRRTRGRK